MTKTERWTWAAQVLENAARLLGRPGTWRAEGLAGDSGGASVDPCSPEAGAWTLAGAVVASGPYPEEAFSALRAACGGALGSFNWRGREEAVRILEVAIRFARTEVEVLSWT